MKDLLSRLERALVPRKVTESWAIFYKGERVKLTKIAYPTSGLARRALTNFCNSEYFLQDGVFSNHIELRDWLLSQKIIEIKEI